MGNLNRLDNWMNDDQRPAGCAVCEAMLPDAVDGVLSESEQRAFEKHIAGCSACAQELSEAQRGAAWLQMLKGHAPEPSASLLTKILAQTTGSEETTAVQAPVAVMPALPAYTRDIQLTAVAARSGGKLLAFRQKMAQIFAIENAQLNFQPRLAMTAAMAFFSIALTLNMTGVKLNNLRLADLQPSNLRRSVVDTTASAARSFYHLRVVYQVESKLEDLQEGGWDVQSPMASPAVQKPAPKSAPVQNDGNGTDQQQDKPKGHSALKFLTVGAEEAVDKGA